MQSLAYREEARNPTFTRLQQVHELSGVQFLEDDPIQTFSDVAR